MLEYIVNENMVQYIDRKDIVSYIDKIKQIEKLLEIKKDELDEREFYEKVLTIIEDMGPKLTPELAALLKQTLKEIGCVTYKEWREGKEKAGEIIEEGDFYTELNNADIPAAVELISQLLYDYSNASYARNIMDERELLKKWLTKSSEIKKNRPVHNISEVEEAIADRTAEGIKNISDEIAAGVLEDVKGNEVEKMDD